MPSKIPAFPLRLRKEEKTRYAAAAREAGVSLSDWLRGAADARAAAQEGRGGDESPARVSGATPGLCLRQRGCQAAVHVGDCPERRHAQTVVAHDQVSDLGVSPYGGRDTRVRSETPPHVRARQKLTLRSCEERRPESQPRS